MQAKPHNKARHADALFSAPLQKGHRCAWRYVKIMTRYLTLLIGLWCSVVFAQDIEVEVDDCGPLAREGLGVAFSLKPHGSGQSYFAKGSAMEICPKLVTAKRVIGYEEPYCKNYKPAHARECEHIKVFVIKEYVFD